MQNQNSPLMETQNKIGVKKLRFIDLFCGIGGFRYALESVASNHSIKSECVFSSDIDKGCQKAYSHNFGEQPYGDITKVDAEEIPGHDILLAGFPCQPFSIIGKMKGFEDTRGTLFFDIARILNAKKPAGFVLENVKLLKGHNQGQTLEQILVTLTDLGYHTEYRVLNALDFGLPQKRERIWIVGLRDQNYISWPEGGLPMKPLSRILEKNVESKFFASQTIREKRRSIMKPQKEPTIWHENKSGHISAYPYSCALRAGASYNYLLVDGERRLTPREMLRLQGFPESFDIVCSDSQTRNQAGNSLPVNVAKHVISSVFESLNLIPTKTKLEKNGNQLTLFEKKGNYGERTKTKKRRKISSSFSSQSISQ